MHDEIEMRRQLWNRTQDLHQALFDTADRNGKCRQSDARFGGGQKSRDAVTAGSNARVRRNLLEPLIDQVLTEFDIEQSDLMLADIDDRARCSLALAIGAARIDRPRCIGDASADQRFVARLDTADRNIGLAFP
jgi:hypothetical protein